MKNYSQVYVKNSIEAAELYCKTFGAEITREFKNETNTAYNVFEMGSEEAVHNAFRILSDGGG